MSKIGDGNPVANIGSKIGTVGVPYVPHQSTVMEHLNTSYYHVHGASFIYPDKAVPVTLTSATASWAETGAIIEVIPANAIIKDFDLHWCSASDISASLYGIVDIFAGESGNEVKIGSVDVTRTSNFSQEGNKPVQIPQQPANTRISCRFSDSTTSAQSCKVKFYGHVYGTSLT